MRFYAMNLKPCSYRYSLVQESDGTPERIPSMLLNHKSPRDARARHNLYNISFLASAAVCCILLNMKDYTSLTN